MSEWSKLAQKGIQDQAWLGGKGAPLVIMQEIKIQLNNQKVYTQTRIRPRE